MLTNTLVLGTHNPKKLKELEGLFCGTGIGVKSLAAFEAPIEVVEDGNSFRENAEKKASQQAVHLGEWVIGEDSGICIRALKGKPGIYSARYAGEQATDDDNNQKVISELEGVEDRSANYVCHIALSNPQGEIVLNVEDTCHGRMGYEPKGTGGFGYDPYFVVPEYDLTMAELGNHVKSIISHRAKAMRKFLKAVVSAKGSLATENKELTEKL